MIFGAAIVPTVKSMPIADLSRWLEDAGFDSLWLGEHTHSVVDDDHTLPSGRPVPSAYGESLDPIASLAVAASATEKIRLGTGICLVNQRDPIITAKAIATLDRFSGGRIDFGVGPGWNRREMANHGVTFGDRFVMFDEKVRAIRRLWRDEPANFHGDHVDFRSVSLRPKPIQDPHPPIFVGGNSDGVLRYLAQYADGWLAREGRQPFLDKVPFLREVTDSLGRPTVDIAVFDCELSRDKMSAYEAAGINRAIVLLRDVAGESMRDQLRDISRACHYFA